MECLKDVVAGSASHAPVTLTEWLVAWSHGDESALQHLVPIVQAELRRLARREMRRERPHHTLQTTALVNEAYLRLVNVSGVTWTDRAHFFAISARLMRRILVDYARARLYQKRGGGVQVLRLDESAPIAADAPDFAALDDALEALARIDPRKSQVVEMRFFGGLSVEETAFALNVSTGTVMRDWRLAKSWLLKELTGARRG